jgi:hypothetical protein
MGVPWEDVLIALGGIVVVLAMVWVIRVNRKDEKDVWKVPEDEERSRSIHSR